MKKTMSALYETNISTPRWLAYDVPGNVGWITYLVCLGKCLGRKRDLFSLLACLPGAAMLPVGYLAYANGGTMTSSTREQRRQARLASREAYGLIRSLGYPTVPNGDEKYYEPGPRGVLMGLLYDGMAKNEAMGDLIACAHCRNAYAEMELLDDAFAKVIQRAGAYPMPNWQKLKAQVPDRETLRRQYLRKRDGA